MRDPRPDSALNELAGYQSPLNGLRVGRAFIWALAAFWLLNRSNSGVDNAGKRFALGMTLGLFGVGCIVLWERLVFTGAFNFLHHYRVSSTFSATSTAGAQIESYLGAAAPFAMLVTLL